MPVSEASYGAGRAAAVAVVACTVLVAALAVWAASIGPEKVVTGEVTEPTPSESGVSPTSNPTIGESPHTSLDNDAPDGELPSFVSVGLSAVLVVFVVLALVGLVMLVRLLQPPRSRRKDARRERAEFEVLPPPPAPSSVAAAIAADAGAQHRALLSGAPRNAIVECWHRFEVHAASAGVPRERWETSSEFTQRVLTMIGASPGAVASLGDVFREARFSKHDVGEDLRDFAVELLREIHESMHRSGASR